MPATVKSVPDAFHTLTPHLVCNDAAAAIEFYKKAFGATEIWRMPRPDGNIMHASVKIGDSILMLNDEFPNWGALGPQPGVRSPVTIHIMVPNVDEMFASAIAAGGIVRMPVADMFWGDRYGVLTDPFGHEWSIATHIRDMTPEEMAEAGRQAMAQMPPSGPDCAGGAKA